MMGVANAQWLFVKQKPWQALPHGHDPARFLVETDLNALEPFHRISC